MIRRLVAAFAYRDRLRALKRSRLNVSARGGSTIEAAYDDQIVRYFLMRATRDGAPREGRHLIWMPPADALQRLSFSEARASLQKALRLMKERGLL